MGGVGSAHACQQNALTYKQHSLEEQREPGASVARTFDQLELVDLSFVIPDLREGSRLHLFERVGESRFPTELLDKPTDRRGRMGVAWCGQLTPDEVGIAAPIIPALEQEGIDLLTIT